MKHLKFFNEMNEGKSKEDLLLNAQDFLENYVMDNFGDVKYNLDNDNNVGEGDFAFVEVYFDKAKFDEIEQALNSNYDEAVKHFAEAAKKAGYDFSEVMTGDDFISYQVTYKPSFKR